MAHLSSTQEEACLFSQHKRQNYTEDITKTRFSPNFFFFFSPLSSLLTSQRSQSAQPQKNHASKLKEKLVEQTRYLIKKGKGHFNADSISFRSEGFPQVPNKDLQVVLSEFQMPCLKKKKRSRTHPHGPWHRQENWFSGLIPFSKFEAPVLHWCLLGIFPDISLMLNCSLFHFLQIDTYGWKHKHM